jgi:membrane-associated phospholipid phosphatase
MQRILLVPIIFFLFSQNAFSSEFLETAKEDALSPFTTKALTVLEIGGGLTLFTLLLKDTFKEDFQSTISRNKPLGKTSKWGDFLGHSVPNIAYALFMGGDYLITKDQLSLDRTILMTKATLYSGAVTDISKRIFSEPRPNGSTFSFPSGHATTAFAFSSVVAMEHSLPWGIAANAMAAFVGFSRINDNAHYLHDVIAGATIGAMYGVGVVEAKKNRDQKATGPSVFLLVPTNDGLMANYSFVY